MTPIAITLIVFTGIFGSAYIGMNIHRFLPAHHLSPESKDVVRLGSGLLSTLAAVVLGLLISSAKDSFDRIQDDLLAAAAKTVMLDRVLAQYGPETQEIRMLVRRNTVEAIDMIKFEGKLVSAKRSAIESAGQWDEVQAKINALIPQSRDQRSFHLRALEISSDLAMARWMLTSKDRSISTPFLVVLVLWLAVIFGSFGFFAPCNRTVVASLLVCSLSVSGAIFIVLEMATPFTGMIQVSSDPLSAALAHLGH